MRQHHGPFDQLARRLVVPEQSGIYIAKSEIIVLANLIEGSLRVNERSRMLADVLKSPNNLVDLAALIGRLIDLCQVHLDHYDGLAEAWPATAEPIAERRAKAAQTLEMLEDLRQELLDDAEDAGLLPA
jgi:hypothetical protein